MNIKQKHISGTGWRIFIILCILFSVKGTKLEAQNCAELLERAQEAFRDGHPESVTGLMENCLLAGFTLNEKVAAFKLLTTAYVLAKDPRADETFQKLLKLNPEFKLDLSQQTDPAELIYLYEDFRTDPRVYIRGQVGINTVNVDVLQGYGTGNTSNPDLIYQYDKKYSFQGGVNLAIPLFHRNVRINAGAYFIQHRYDATMELETYAGESISSASDLDNSTLFFTENQNTLQFPLSVSVDFDRWSKYNFEKSRLVPFIYGGISFQHLLKARLTDLRRTGLEAGLRSEPINELRNTHNLALVLGAGIKFKILRRQLVLDVKYHQWLKNIVNTSSRYKLPELTYTYGYVDNDLMFKTLSISLGYEIPYYKPARRKHAK